jgi:DNA end-binding protein Ku
MASHSTGSFVIGFGPLTCMVKTYVSASPTRIGFKWINKKTGNLVGQKKFDKVTNEEVQQADIINGYEYSKDKYLHFTDVEVDNMQATKKDTMEIAEFVPISSIDPLQVEKTFYLQPDKGQDGNYKLFSVVLAKCGRAAVGKWVSRGKEHLVVIRAYQHGIIMHQMFYHNEVRGFEDKCSAVPLNERNVKIAEEMISYGLSETFDSKKYADMFVDKLNAAVAKKLANPDEPITADTGAALKVIDQGDAMLAWLDAKRKEKAQPVAEPVVEKPEPLKLTSKPAKKARAKKAS